MLSISRYQKPFFWVCLLSALLPLRTWGQTPTPPENGYLELVQAGNLLLQNSVFLSKIRDKDAYNNPKEIMQLAEVKEAQRLLRRGLQKPIQLIEEKDATDVESFLAAQAELDRYPQLRMLTALCAMEHAAETKEGHPTEAVTALQNILRLRQVVSDKSLMGWRIGRSMLETVTRSTNIALRTATVEQIRLYPPLLEPLLTAPPSLLPILIEAEQQAYKPIQEMDNNAKSRQAELDTLRKQNAKAAAEVEGYLKKHEKESSPYLKRVHTIIEGYFTTLRESLDRAAVLREKPLLPNPKSPEGKLFQLLVPNYASLLSLHDQEILNLRMTLLHARLKQYKAETGEFPDTLDALQPGILSIDPFTAKPFVYQKAKETFVLNLPKP